MTFESLEMLPDAEELAALVIKQGGLSVRIPAQLDSANAWGYDTPTHPLAALKREVATHLPGDCAIEIGSRKLSDEPAKWDANGKCAVWSWLTIYHHPLTNEQVLPYAEAISAAARDQDSLVTDLMLRLVAQLGDRPEPFAEYDGYWHKYKQSGRMGEWGYWFHGYDCAFGNHETKQQVQAGQGNANVTGYGFGLLNPYFFGDYCRSTPAHAHLARSSLFNQDNWPRAWDILAQHNYLQQVLIKWGWDSGFVVPQSDKSPGS